MRSLHSSSSPTWWRNCKSFSSFTVCWFAILWGIIGCCRIDFFGDSDHNTNTRRPKLWVYSFSPESSLLQQKCAFRRQGHPQCHNTKTQNQKAWKSLTLPLPLYASGENDTGNDNLKSTDTMVVYSVFSKTPKKVFRELLAAKTTTVSNEEAGSLRLEDIHTVTDDGEEARWNELDEIIQDGDLSVQELKNLYDSALGDDPGEGLDLEGFKRFYQSIDNLFDDDDDDDEDDEGDDGETVEDDDSNGDEKAGNNPDTAETESSKSNAKEDLVSYIEEVQERDCYSDDGTVNVGKRRPWGLDCTDKERNKILGFIENLVVENSDSNILASGSNSNGLPMSSKDLTKFMLGTWDLKYTNSRTMIINKSLSGLGRSTSDMARNLGLQMTLSGNYYFGKAEFVETFGSDSVGDDEERILLEAKVTGEWLLETGTRMNYETGRPSVSLRVEVETIAYGPNKSNAEQWDSLSPIKLVDILYLDDNLLVLRGNFNVDAIFVYTRR